MTIPIFIHRYHNYDDVDVYIKVVQDNNCKKAFLNINSNKYIVIVLQLHVKKQ